MLSMQGARVPSLVRELTCHVVWPKKKRKSIFMKFSSISSFHVYPFSLWVSSYLFFLCFNSLYTNFYCYSFVCKWSKLNKVEIYSCGIEGDPHYLPLKFLSELLNIRIKQQTISSSLRFHYACGSSAIDRSRK